MSSDLTQEELAIPHVASTDVAQAAVASTSSGLTAIKSLDAIIDSRAGRAQDDRYGLRRAPFIFTRVGRKDGVGDNYPDYSPSAGSEWNIIYAALSPSEVSYQFALRGQLEKCGGGEVLHMFEADEERAESLGRYLDEPKITYTLTTGNCLPVSTADGDIAIPAGLDAYFALIELLLEDPRLLPDGRSNDIIIIQSSVVFPQLTIEGKVDPAGISFVESAENPTEIRGVQFTVSVKRITPRVTNHAALRAQFEDAEFGQDSIRV